MPDENKTTGVETRVWQRLLAVEELTPAQRKAYERLRALSREAAKHKIPGATSDRRDMYDEFGLSR